MTEKPLVEILCSHPALADLDDEPAGAALIAAGVERLMAANDRAAAVKLAQAIAAAHAEQLP